VFRSGGWYYATITNVRAAIRGGNAPLLHDDGVGFRTVQKGVKLSYDENPPMRRPAK